MEGATPTKAKRMGSKVSGQQSELPDTKDQTTNAPADVQNYSDHSKYKMSTETQHMLINEFCTPEVKNRDKENKPTRKLNTKFDEMYEDLDDDVIHELIMKFSVELGAKTHTEADNAIPQSYMKQDVEIIDLTEGEDHEGPQIDTVVQIPEPYQARRQHPCKPSWYLVSPFDEHVENANVDEDARILASFAWDHELNEDEPMYKSRPRAIFGLARESMWTLQKDECGSSRVIDAWTNILNNKEERPRMKRIYTMVAHDIIESLPFD